MRLREYFGIAMLCLAAVALISGCNGTHVASNQPPSTSNPPSTTPPTTSPPTAPPPTTPRPSGQSFAVSMGSYSNGSNAGELTISASGAAVLNLKGLTPSSPFLLEFCPYPNGDQATCPGVDTFSSDANGAAQATFQYPNKGVFVGAFTVVNNATQKIEATSMWEQPITGANYSAGIFQASAVSGGIGAQKTVGTDPLASGFVTTTNTSVHIELQGAAPNATYAIAVDGNADGSSSFFFNNITTDASGNASQDFPMTGDGPIDEFLFGRNNATEFASGFKVQ